MNPYRRVFGSRPTLLPVVHVLNAEQMLANLRVVFGERPVDGVFLIGHGMSYATLVKLYRVARAQFPDRWIGLNCLDLSAREVFAEMPPGVSGVWTDDAGIREGDEPQYEAATIKRVHEIWMPEGIYFGGVDFKYQRRVENPAKAARLAAPYVDAITTTGAATGSPPSFEKIEAMRGAIDDHPLAIASGISVYNVGAFIRLGVDCFLVASSITDGNELIVPEKLQALQDAMQAQ